MEQIKNRKTQLDDLYEYNEMVLETWYDDYKDKYPHIIQSFQRYLRPLLMLFPIHHQHIQ